jgi:hypothetical protein
VVCKTDGGGGVVVCGSNFVRKKINQSTTTARDLLLATTVLRLALSFSRCGVSGGVV